MTGLTAIIALIFLTGITNPFICIVIHLLGLILFALSLSRQLWYLFIMLFQWFDLIFVFSIEMPPFSNRVGKIKEEMSQEQKRRIRNDCDKALFDTINRYLKNIPNEFEINKLNIGNSSLQDTLSIAITFSKRKIKHFTFFWITDNVMLYKHFYFDSLFNTNKYIWEEKTEVNEASNGPVVNKVPIYGYLPDFYLQLKKRVSNSKT